MLTSVIPTVLADEVKSADSMPESEKFTETIEVGSVIDTSPNFISMPDESITETTEPEVVSETEFPYVAENTETVGDETIDQQVLNIDEVGADIQLAAD